MQPGEVVGLIGRNGAGKSTLLGIIAGTLEASDGEVHANGRISAILELGTGFNPHYTGRENIYLGPVPRFDAQEIDNRQAEIIAFSELETLSTSRSRPFQRYASAPDLQRGGERRSRHLDRGRGAVGRRREIPAQSFDRMKSFRRRGKTILVVSHEINTLTALCDRAILLDRGEIKKDGDPNSVGKAYHELLFAPKEPMAAVPSAAGRRRRGGDHDRAGALPATIAPSLSIRWCWMKPAAP